MSLFEVGLAGVAGATPEPSHLLPEGPLATHRTQQAAYRLFDRLLTLLQDDSMIPEDNRQEHSIMATIVDDRALAQCRFEVHLANRLRSSTKSERSALYGEVYDAYALQFPEALSPNADKKKTIAYESAFVRKFTQPTSVVVEIGPGRCGLSFSVAPYVRAVYGVDVASCLETDAVLPANFKLLLCDGLHLPFTDESADIVVSNELVEHLHPDDAIDQITEAYRILKPGGIYLCGTPNRISGPHDCSNIAPDLPCDVVDNMYVANGLHLKEYTNGGLATLFYRTGFRQIVPYIGARGKYVPMSIHAMTMVEAAAKRIPLAKRSRSSVLRALLGIRMRAVK